jgi:hypothetical protein
MGGIGNVMFKLSTTISLALDNNVDYIFSNEFIRPADMVATKGLPDYRRYYTNILRNIKFIDKLPGEYFTHSEKQFNFNKIQYTNGTNLLIEGHYQSEKYFENNKEYIINLYKPTDQIVNDIIEKLPNIQSYCSIHVRRGDYLVYPNHHPQQSIEYYKKSCEIIGLDKTFLIFSDDLNDIKDMFDFIPNKIFITFNEDWLDLYAMSLCEHNIICNSTFSWWGAYLNLNKNKKIITTNNWFGSEYHGFDISTLFPENWIRI